MSSTTQTATPPATGALLGYWRPNGSVPKASADALAKAIYDINRPVTVTAVDNVYVPAEGGAATLGAATAKADEYPILAYVPPLPLRALGDPGFCADYGLRYAYVSGAMANGIASTDIVIAMGKAGMLGFFGAAGLPLTQVEKAIDRIQAEPGDFPYGFNLIHSPNEQDLEAAVVDLYNARGVHLVEASAYLGLTPSVVYYRVHGIHRNADGDIVTPNRIIAKISRIEVATKFFSPPPARILQELVAAGKITSEQAELAGHIPMAQDITVESDSGGHTDNQQAVTLFPTIRALMDRLQAEFGYKQALRLGAGGGVATPFSATAFLSMGAAYLVTGTINQCTVEAGTSDTTRAMLAQARQADITMAPAADMFEMGVKVQVLKRGTMFAMRAAKLYDIYRSCDSMDSIPPEGRQALEKQIFRQPLASVWDGTKAFFEQRDPSQITRAEQDPKHKMALVFRWYLGQSSRWANAGEPDRKIDYQIWCGPAMGAFNEWVAGSFLEEPRARSVVTIAHNILYGSAAQMRINMLRCQGISLAPEYAVVPPVETAEIKEFL